MYAQKPHLIINYLITNLEPHGPAMLNGGLFGIYGATYTDLFD